MIAKLKTPDQFRKFHRLFYKFFSGSFRHILEHLQGFFRTVFHTLQAEDTLCPVELSPGIIRHIHIHGANAPAFAAREAFALVTLDPQKGKRAHGH